MLETGWAGGKIHRKNDNQVGGNTRRRKPGREKPSGLQHTCAKGPFWTNVKTFVLEEKRGGGA